MFSSVLSADVRGITGVPILVETDISDGLPGLTMVGYLTSAVKESADRVRTALKNTGISIPPKKITINLAPADTKKIYETMPEVLSEREKEVICLRYGLYGGRECTQREVAERLGISRSYISRIEKNAIEKLRSCFS